jgi:hypothetical protein
MGFCQSDTIRSNRHSDSPISIICYRRVMDGSTVDLLDSSWQVLRMFEDHRESEHFKIIQRDEYPLRSKGSKIVQVGSTCYLV